MSAMIDFPNRRVDQDMECECCGVLVPAGVWLARLPHGVECCSSTCIAIEEQRIEEEADAEDPPLDPDDDASEDDGPRELRRLASAKESEAEDKRMDADDLEASATRLRRRADELEQREKAQVSRPQLLHA